MPARIAPTAGVLLFALALGGCDDGCPRLHDCDVREAGCQRQVMKAVACMRGGDSDDLPKVSVISEGEFIDIVAAYGEEDPDAQAEAAAAYRLWTRGLSLFGLAPVDYAVEDARADSAAQTAAAYLHDTHEIVIIDRGHLGNLSSTMEIFAHEVVHALQDQELDLDAYQDRFATDFDASLALDAIVEGEAVHYQVLAAVNIAGRSADDVNWERLYTDWRAETLLDAEADEAPVALADLRFPYAFGGEYVTQHWLARGRAGIDGLFEDPPRTTSEVLFGSDREELEAEREVLHQHAVPALPEPFVEGPEAALGAWVARMYAARAGLEVKERSELALRLAADVFSVHLDAESDLLVAAWRTRFKPEFSPGAWPAIEGATLVVGAEDVNLDREAFLIAADPELPAGAEALAWRAPTEEEAEGDAASASAGAWRSARVRGRVRACAGRRPRL